MIVQDNFLKKLRSAFNLNIYEVRIWTALLSRGIATAGELSDISNVPRSRTYDVLESLEKKGFVIMKLGKPIRYIAVEPKEIIKRVRKSIENKLNKELESVEHVRNTNLFKEIELLYKNGIDHVEPSSLSGSIMGRDNVYDHMESMMNKAKKSVIISTSAEGFTRKMKLFDKLFKTLTNNGVKININTPLNDEVKNFVKENGKIKVKNLKELNARFVVVDGKEVLFMVADDKNLHESADVGIWVDTPFFASALEKLFNLNWNKEK
jgi:sugar-specific transcriptional regulator TrmB